MNAPRCSLFAAALALLVACAPPPYEPSADDTPRIDVVFPETGDEMVYCSSFMVAVDIDNLEVFYPATDEPLVEGQGHWHLKLPNTQVRAIGVPYYFVDGTPSTGEGDEDGPDGPFAPGTYTFTAELVDNAHAPLPDIDPVVFEIRIDDDPDGDPMTNDCLGGGGGSNEPYDTGGADDTGDSGGGSDSGA